MLEIMIWDVQHGSATYAKTPEGKHFVIDLGTGSFVGDNDEFSPLLHLKNNYGITSIDEVIITHPHTDHLDDIFNFDKLSPKALRRPKHLTEDDIRKANPDSDSDKIDKYLEINDRFNLTIKDEDNPELPENNGGVKFHCFTPTNCGKSNINNHSIVTVIEYLGVKVIIPGDNESASWKELLENSSFVKAISNANILVASHHGRDSGYCEEIFEHFTPDLVIVSDDEETDTSVTDKYTKKANGWTVFKRSDRSSKKRYCLTTRNDGEILIKIGKDSNGKVFMNVSIV
ncbi:hypothetical protein Tfer_3284 [Thermincola ferriacetica]|uniref:Metallo-beta-lactamase domain-containing protein n=1 Tax=Thermincola ferriacetica TaxID=281456 RepID=A0A0L6VXX3_9FIRM|nr:MBL fold metallo-hydrolase [Thermincola ferriacetica]KNZ68182.1 hypothetical protein Tfer_3284 [Thermincola ferriacetica]